MTKNMVEELTRTMDGMCRVVRLQQELLEQASAQLAMDNREERDWVTMVEERDQEIRALQEQLNTSQRLNTRLNEENNRLEKQNQELLRLIRN